MSAAYDKLVFYAAMALLNIGVLGAVGFAHMLPAAVPAPVVVAAAPSAPVEQKVAPEKPVTKTGTPVRIVVPDRDIDLSVQPGNFDVATGTWTLGDYSAYYATPTVPVNDTRGTTLIYGHNIPTIFRGLHQLASGDELLVYTDTGFLFRYRFESVQEVTPQTVDLFPAHGPPSVILQTCSGLWSEYRKLFLFNLISIEEA